MLIHVCWSLFSLFLSPVWLLLYWHCKEKLGLVYGLFTKKAPYQQKWLILFRYWKRKQQWWQNDCPQNILLWLPNQYFCMSELFYFVLIIVCWSLCVDHCKVSYYNIITERESGNKIDILMNKIKVTMSHWTQKINSKRLARTSNPWVTGFKLFLWLVQPQTLHNISH